MNAAGVLTKQNKGSMKLNRLSLVAALVVAVLALCTRTASAQDEKEGKGKRGPSVEQQMTRLTEALSLTDEQKPKVKAVLEDSAKKRQEIFADTSTPRDQLREKMRPIMEEQDKKLKEIRKPDQYEKYEKMRDEMRRNRGQGGEKKKKEN
jgi:Spy/CpxP family protein refolding chaperone